MVQTNLGHHHLSVRKRIHQKHEEYPHPEKFKRFLDKIMYPVVLIEPLMLVPQILKIFIEKSASNISLISWSLFLLPAIMWLIYGFVHKNKLIIISNIAWLITYCIMILGTIIY